MYSYPEVAGWVAHKQKKKLVVSSERVGVIKTSFKELLNAVQKYGLCGYQSN
jgi:hypothetical protein